MQGLEFKGKNGLLRLQHVAHAGAAVAVGGEGGVVRRMRQRQHVRAHALPLLLLAAHARRGGADLLLQGQPLVLLVVAGFHHLGAGAVEFLIQPMAGEDRQVHRNPGGEKVGGARKKALAVGGANRDLRQEILLGHLHASLGDPHLGLGHAQQRLGRGRLLGSRRAWRQARPVRIDLRRLIAAECLGNVGQRRRFIRGERALVVAQFVLGETGAQHIALRSVARAVAGHGRVDVLTRQRLLPLHRRHGLARVHRRKPGAPQGENQLRAFGFAVEVLLRGLRLQLVTFEGQLADRRKALADADAEHGHALLRQREAVGGQVDRVERHMRVGQLRGRRGLVLDGADALRGCGQAGVAPRQLGLGGTEGQGRGLGGCGQAGEQ